MTELEHAARIVLTALENADIAGDTLIWWEERDLLWQALERQRLQSPPDPSVSPAQAPQVLVQRLIDALYRRLGEFEVTPDVVLEAEAWLRAPSRATPEQDYVVPPTLGSLSVAETQSLLGSDRPISIGKVPTDPIGMRTIAAVVSERLVRVRHQSPHNGPSSLSLHRCKVCGTRWLLWPAGVGGTKEPGWNLLDKYSEPGQCCNNVAMGAQIEHLRDFDVAPSRATPEEAEKTPWTIDGSMPLPVCVNDTVRRADVVTMWNDWRCGLPANAPFRHSDGVAFLNKLNEIPSASRATSAPQEPKP